MDPDGTPERPTADLRPDDQLTSVLARPRRCRAGHDQPDNPTWRFRYGKLLAANHQDAEAQANLSKALELGEKTEPKPKWLPDAHQLYARALGDRKEAIPHWEAFLRDGPQESPYRKEAKKKLEELGKPWDGP